MPGAGEHPLIYGSGWDPGWSAALPSNANTFVAGLNCDAAFHSWTDAPGANELKPINCIASLEAFAFCAWDGGRLSTEAEWNYAAAGGSEQRTYAWGSAAPTPEHASYSCLGDGVPGCTLNDLIAVGTKPRGNGKYGHADLAGNVFEWNLDFQNCCAPPWPGYVSTSCVDCAYLTSSGERELRGGSFPGDETWLPTSFRGWGGPRVYDIGARCARSP
jgi:formylglycine-generating enzyme required for sulfatase activity